MKYNLILKNSKSLVFSTEASNKKEATSFFMNRKQMTEKQFEKLFEVKTN